MEIHDAVDSKKKLSTAKPLVKGFNFYKSGNVISISVLKKSGEDYFKSQVLPSMKKNLIYQYNIAMSSIAQDQNDLLRFSPSFDCISFISRSPCGRRT